MTRGPRWTLRLAALALGSTPFLHMLWTRGSLATLRPFQDLDVLGQLFEGAAGAWFFCWVLPWVASLPSWRSDWTTSALSFAAYAGLLISQLGAWPGFPMNLILTAGGLFLVGLLLCRVEVEVAAAWARLGVAATLLAACAAQALAREPLSVGLFGVAAGALLWGLAELALLRDVPKEEDGANS